MEELRKTIGKNLSELRKRKKYTQYDLGELLQYSDKTISKWEKGESLPSVEILYHLCNLYGVTLDYLVHEGSYEEKKSFRKKDKSKINKIMITFLSLSLIWFLVIIGYVYPYVLLHLNLWILFIWGIPSSFLLLLIFNRIWGKRKYKFFIISMLIWSLLTALFLLLIFLNQSYQVWAIFLLGIPAQVAIVLWSQIKR